MATITRTTVGTLNGVTGSSRDFHFASDGVNTTAATSGTAASPWLDLRNVNNNVNVLDSIEAGDRFLFKANDTIQHVSNFFGPTDIAGTVAAPIVFGAWEGSGYTATPTVNPILVRNSYLNRTMTRSVAYPNTPIYYFSVAGWTNAEGCLWENGEVVPATRNLNDLLEPADGGNYDGTYSTWPAALHASDGGGPGIYWRPTSGKEQTTETVWIADGNWGGNIFGPEAVAQTANNYVFENLDCKHSATFIYQSDAAKHFENITIRNCNISHMTAAGIQFLSGTTAGPDGLKNILVDNCEISYCSAGVIFYASSNQVFPSDGCRATNNHIHHINYLNVYENIRQNVAAQSVDSEGFGIQNAQNSLFFNNDIHDIGMPDPADANDSANGAIVFWNHNSAAGVPNGNTIMSNRIRDVEIGIAGLHNQYYVTDSTNNIICGNTLDNCTSLGIKLYMQGSTNRCINNTLNNCDVGIWYGATGGGTVESNIITNPKSHWQSTSQASAVSFSVNKNIFYGEPDPLTSFAHSAGTVHPYTGTGVPLLIWRTYTGSPDLSSDTTIDPQLNVNLVTGNTALKGTGTTFGFYKDANGRPFRLPPAKGAYEFTAGLNAQTRTATTANRTGATARTDR